MPEEVCPEQNVKTIEDRKNSHQREKKEISINGNFFFI
jgi:hypothetical protein